LSTGSGCWFFSLDEVTEQEEEEEVERGTAPRLWLSSLYSRLEELHTETEKSRYRTGSPLTAMIHLEGPLS
jgi:hypothetical protein